MSCRAVLVAAFAVAAGCSKSEVKDGGSTGSGAPNAPAKPTFTLFALAEVRGQIGPCGCTSDPLGDLARTAQMIADARAAGPTLVVDAGSLLYSKDVISDQVAAQEELKADLLAQTYRDDLGVAALGLGPADLVRGPGKVRTPRQAVNAAAEGLPLGKPVVAVAGTTKVGVFGVIAAGAVAGVTISDPIAAGKAAIGQLRGQGATVVVALVQAASRRDAVQLVRDIGGIDVAVAGLGKVAPEPEAVDVAPTKVGDGWLVIPANRGQVVSRLEITLRGAGPLVDAGGPAAAAAKIAGVEKLVAELDAELVRFTADPSADPAFVRQKQAERAQLVAQRDQLRRQPLAIPARGSYFTLEQARINKTRTCSPKVQDAVTAFYRAVGETNVAAARGAKAPPPVPKGQAAYVGNEVCDDCHGEALEFWAKSRHANAWETLEQRGQQFDFDCISCHVTGWGRPSGATLARNEGLRDVGCETCHGPASIHVAKGGKEKPSAVIRNPPVAFCATECHTKEHSDTFQYEAYMRDIVGPGHGEPMRKQLGDGPTGGQLRKAALAKAGRMGAGCIR